MHFSPIPTLQTLSAKKLFGPTEIVTSKCNDDLYNVFDKDSRGSSQQVVALKALAAMDQSHKATLPLFPSACDEYIDLVLPAIKGRTENLIHRGDLKQLKKFVEHLSDFYLDENLPYAVKEDLHKVFQSLNNEILKLTNKKHQREQERMAELKQRDPLLYKQEKTLKVHTHATTMQSEKQVAALTEKYMRDFIGALNQESFAYKKIDVNHFKSFEATLSDLKANLFSDTQAKINLNLFREEKSPDDSF